MRATGVSTGYTGASGGGNVFLTSPGPRDFQIAGINTTGLATFTLSFGVSRSNASQTLSELSLEYSTDGTNYAPITVPTQTGATGWIKLTLSSLSLPSTSNLRLKWRNNSSSASGGQQLRIDDIVLVGAAATDTTPPTLGSLSPTNGAVDVAGGTNLVATFSEIVAAGTGNIVITKTAGSVVFATIPVTDPQVVFAGSTVTINPTADLDLSTGYNVQIPLGAIKDAAGNDYAGITNSTTWAFTTVAPDTTGPTIVSTIPTNSATGVTPVSSISVTFNEPIQTPLTAANFIVKRADNSTFATVSSSAFGTLVTTSGNTATITLPATLEYGTSYYVEIEPGAIEDASANPFAGYTGSATWSFTTVNVPSLTATAYTQDFSTFTSATNLASATTLLPLGWSVSGPDLSYDGNFGTGSTGGFRGNANVLAYQHTGSTGVLTETLTLRNGTVDPITDLIVSYVGRDNGPATLGSRTPAFVVTVNGTPVTGLAYSTASGDNVTRTATISGLSIAPNATFSIAWSSDGPNTAGNGSRRQIGISNVSVSIGVQLFAPTVTNSLTTGSLSHASAGFSGEVTADGGDPVTARGFVYSLTSANAAPTIGGTGVTAVADGSPGVGTFSTTVTGLTAASGYTFRAYATNTIGTTYGNALTFTTLPTPPNFTTSYTQLFAAYNGSNPAGWSTVSSGGAQAYAGAWGNVGGSAGFTGGDSSPGVLGYQHTGGTGTLTTTLTLINNTGGTLDQLYISYLGRASRTTEGRSPAFVVSVNGVPVTGLAYSTSANVDITVSATLTGLGIASGAPFTISWVSDRGTGSGSSKQIGMTDVLVALPTAPVLASASATAITSTTATLNGSVTSDGYSAITERGFVYSPTATNSDPLIDGTGVIKEVDGAVTTGALTKALTGLTASTGYSLKAYAINGLGTTYSAVATFSTTALGLSYDTWNDAIANQAANLDFDGDGISNGAEFFMGTAGNAFTVNPGISAGTVTWPRAAGTTIASFKVEVSTDLSTWENATDNYIDNLTITATEVTFTMPTGPGSFFVRLNVTP
jgi:hypothetical protein